MILLFPRRRPAPSKHCSAQQCNTRSESRKHTPPLREVAKERCRGSNATWTIGALPANYNVRFLHPPTDGDLVLKRGSANVSDSLFGALDGPAVVLHSHFYLHWMSKSTRGLISQTRQACGVLNQNSRLRIFANGRVEVLS